MVKTKETPLIDRAIMETHKKLIDRLLGIAVLEKNPQKHAEDRAADWLKYPCGMRVELAKMAGHYAVAWTQVARILEAGIENEDWAAKLESERDEQYD